METVKAIIDGEEIDLVVKLDDEELLDDVSIKSNSNPLEDTIDLTEDLSNTVELDKNADWRNE